MTDLTAPPLELAVDDRLKTRLAALLEVTTLDFPAMTRAAGLDPATSFRGTRIRGVDFGESDLTGFDFTGANLVDCDFSRARTEGAIFAGARLEGVSGLGRRLMVLISRAFADNLVATAIVDGLQWRGVHGSITIDDEILNPAAFTLHRPHIFLPIASQRSAASVWMNAEWRDSMSKAVEGGLTIIPLLLDVTVEELPPPLQRFQALDLRDMDAALDHLAVEIFRERPATKVSLDGGRSDGLEDGLLEGRAETDGYDNSHEVMEQLITDELVDQRFDNFHPGHYGYDLHEVYIDTVDRLDGKLVAHGSISATAQLGASSDEYGVKMDYRSGFRAVFHVDPPEDEVEGISLEELSLEKGDWIEPGPEPEPEDWENEAPPVQGTGPSEEQEASLSPDQRPHLA